MAVPGVGSGCDFSAGSGCDSPARSSGCDSPVPSSGCDYKDSMFVDKDSMFADKDSMFWVPNTALATDEGMHGVAKLFDLNYWAAQPVQSSGHDPLPIAISTFGTDGAEHFSGTDGAEHFSGTDGAEHFSGTDGAEHFSGTDGAEHFNEQGPLPIAISTYKAFDSGVLALGLAATVGALVAEYGPAIASGLAALEGTTVALAAFITPTRVWERITEPVDHSS